MMFKNAKVGDKVWDIHRGWGEIISITRTRDYPLRVKFPVTAVSTYTFEGKSLSVDINPSLYWDEIKVIPPKKPPPDLAVDTKVLVWNNGRNKFKAHFHSFSQNGRMITWPNGRTSFTSTDSPNVWDNWELYEE